MKANKYFCITEDGRYKTKCRIEYKEVGIPRGYVFDGVSVKAPFTGFFSNKILRGGLMGSCVHDWMCDHKDRFDRKTATRYLIELWPLDGWRAWLVKRAVNRYQKSRGW